MSVRKRAEVAKIVAGQAEHGAGARHEEVEGAVVREVISDEAGVIAALAVEVGDEHVRRGRLLTGLDLGFGLRPHLAAEIGVLEAEGEDRPVGGAMRVARFAIVDTHSVKVLDARGGKLDLFPRHHRFFHREDLVDRTRPRFEDEIVVLADQDTASLREPTAVLVAGIRQGERAPFREFDQFVHGLN